MSFFTWIVILLCIYAPWVFPLLLVLFVLACIYYTCPVLFWILIGAFVILCIWVAIDMNKDI